MYRKSSIYYPQDEMTTMMIPLTTGCPYNKCLFCTMYKDDEYCEVPLDEIRQQLINGSKYTEKVFLTGADPLFIGYSKLIIILEEIKNHLKYCAQVSSYASIRSVLGYSYEELDRLHHTGLRLLYIGFESGSDKYLELMKKGHTKEEAIIAGKKLDQLEIPYSAIILTGIGGKGTWELNAKETSCMLNQIKPRTIITMNLMVMEGSELNKLVKKGEYIQATNREHLLELKAIIEVLNPEKIIEFDTTHPSNKFKIRGSLLKDKSKLLREINRALGK